MGCTQSAINNDPIVNNNNNKGGKNANNNNNANKNAAAADANGAGAATAPVPKTNPYLSLSAKDIYSLKASWKAIRRSMEETGTLMFTKLFENNKNMLKYFEKFKDMDAAKLASSTVLAAHGAAVMAELDEVITELDDGDKCQARLKSLGARHKNRGMETSDFFLEMKIPFLHAIETVLGDRYSDRMRVIYETVTDYILKTLSEGFDGK